MCGSIRPRYFGGRNRLSLHYLSNFGIGDHFGFAFGSLASDVTRRRGVFVLDLLPGDVSSNHANDSLGISDIYGGMFSVVHF